MKLSQSYAINHAETEQSKGGQQNIERQETENMKNKLKLAYKRVNAEYAVHLGK